MDAGRAQKAEVEGGVVGDDCAHIGADKGAQLGQHALERRRIGHVGVTNVGDLGDARWNRSLRVDQCGETIEHGVGGELDRADLDDRILAGVQAGGFQVKRDIDALWHGVSVPC
jgi:hypothetical protein